jgi:hypothetical protein
MTQKQQHQLESIADLARKQGTSIVSTINMLFGLAALNNEWDLMDELCALRQILGGVA